MQIDSSTAVVDNDFIIHLVESRLDDDVLLNSIRRIFDDLGLTALIHPLVYEKELPRDNVRVKLMFRQSIIQKVQFADIFQNEEQEEYYYFLVQELYHARTGNDFPASGKEIQVYWKRRDSLGEVHSISMCMVCGCGIFFSDDKDSKWLGNYIRNKAMGSITVYNRTELVDKYLEESTETILRAVRKSLTHTGT